MSETRKLAAILAADVVGFSRLASADEDRTLARLRALRSDLIDPTIALHHGRVVKRTGDGILIEFRSVVDAIRCAIECQNGMIERNAGLPPEKRIEFRVGIHLGDVVEESDGDLMGDGVNIASRLEGIAKPGAIYLSEDAYRQVKARLDVAVRDVGEQKLKNIADPVRVYSVEVGKPGERAKAGPAARSRLVPALAALAAILALAGAGAWHWSAGRPPTNGAGAAPFGVPTVAILPFVNVTGDPQYESLTQRIGQKMRDDASNASIWRIVGRSAGTGGADPIDAGRQLNADYVVTGNLEAGGDPLRVTLQLADVHSSARLWSQTISPVLEKPNTAAAEAEVAGRAESLLGEAILDAERTRLSSAGDITKTTWGCVLLGFNAKPETVASARECLEAATRREPSNPNVWESLVEVINGRGFGDGACPPRRRVSASASISPTESCRRRCTLKISRP